MERLLVPFWGVFGALRRVEVITEVGKHTEKHRARETVVPQEEEEEEEEELACTQERLSPYL